MYRLFNGVHPPLNGVKKGMQKGFFGRNETKTKKEKQIRDFGYKTVLPV